jgi:hypothetical protein
MSEREAIYRLNECECYNAGLRCVGCEWAVETLTKLFYEKNATPQDKQETTIQAQ